MSFKHLLVSLALFLSACVSQAQIIGGGSTVGNFLANDGTVTAPSYSFVGAQTLGFFRDSVTGRVAFGAASTKSMEFASGGLILSGSGGIYFNSALDTILTRNGTSTLGVNAGGQTVSYANIGGVLFLEANNVVQSSASQTLHSYTVPASVMTVNGKTLRVTALFLTVNNANAKALGFTVCGGSLIDNVTASIAGAIRATAYITRTAANTWTTNVIYEEGIASGTLTQAKMSMTANSVPSCTDGATNTILANVNTVGATDTSSGFFMVELLN